MNQPDVIPHFTPSLASPERLESVFVQRHALLRDAEDRVRESVVSGNKHHMLFVGQRGSGKTHFVSLLVHRASSNPELKEKLRIAWLNEDETCTSFFDLLVKIFEALSKRYPDQFRDDEIEPVYEMETVEAERFLGSLLLKQLNKRTPLVVAENLDILFQSIGNEGQKKLRAFLQEHPVFAFLTTAQALVDDLTDRGGPFFGFFQTEHFKPLSLEDAVELLGKITKQNGDEEVPAFLATAKGRSRARALHFLSGGNHRIFVVLCQFITRENIEDLIVPFQKMIDELTPYYQERIRALPPLQRKIVEFLCKSAQTVPVKMIAKKMRSTHQTVSSQLKDLRAKRYVKSHTRGRESLYEVTEPLMRICIEVKDNHNRGPLNLLVDFIRIWYESEELKRRKETSRQGTLAYSYFEAAVQRMAAEGDLRSEILVADLRSETSTKMSGERLGRLPESLEDAPRRETLAVNYGESDENLEPLPSPRVREIDPSPFALRGFESDALGGKEEAVGDRAATAEMNDNPADPLALALFKRGVIYGQSGDSARASAYFSAVAKLDDAPAVVTANALTGRGIGRSLADELGAAESDFGRVLQIKGIPVELSSIALVGLAKIRARQGRWNEAFERLNDALTCGQEVSPRYVCDLEELLDILYHAGLVRKALEAQVSQFLGVAKKRDVLVELGESLVRHLGAAQEENDPIWLERWGDVWNSAVDRIPELAIAMRMFRCGVEYLCSKDRDTTILSQLRSEERVLLRKTLGLERETR